MKNIPTKCDRCGCNLETTSHTMSRFNTDTICMACQEVERRHPKYRNAVETELEQIRRGNYNYDGIGLPQELQELAWCVTTARACQDSARKWADAAQQAWFKSSEAAQFAQKALHASLDAQTAALEAALAARTGDLSAAKAAEEKTIKAADTTAQYAADAIQAWQNEKKSN